MQPKINLFSLICSALFVLNIAVFDSKAHAETLNNGNNPVVSISNIRVKNLSLKYGLGPEPHVKSVLEVIYKYKNTEGFEESGTQYQWYIGDSKNGQYTKLAGIHAKTIILLKEYIGKYLKCEVTAQDVKGNKAKTVISASTKTGVLLTDANPLTDWFYEAKYGLSHHLLKEFIERSFTPVQEQWDASKQTWSQFIDQFNVQEYAKQVNETGAKFILLTLNQNSGYYNTPVAAYDKYMRQAGLLKDEDDNPMTSKRDLPGEIMDELAKYGIKVMLYHPSNPPNRSHWKGNDFRVTSEVFHYTPGQNGAPGDTARQVLNEIISELGARYGEKLAGFWFDGFYKEPASVYLDMNNVYNISDFANAAKKGNPYRIIAYNTGWGAPFRKSTPYSDYSAGEDPNLGSIPSQGRFTDDDCQKMMWGPLGSMYDVHGWGCPGTSKETDFVVNRTDTLNSLGAVMILDTRVSIFGVLDPKQVAQLLEVKKRVSP
ncbi:hypothetical protein EZS27_023086 [termite gut metagenome]|uniref:Glycoside hydrolase family 29 N-terminal domain-containing protein n=1 Tax=termite gut metagenome TaxID=433724 RepID=A0A5J4R5X7_9ZZZZ